MKANVLSLHTPTTPGVGSKGHFFSSKGKTLNLHTPLTYGVEFKGQISRELD